MSESSVYVIVEVLEVKNGPALKAYASASVLQVGDYGGKIVARGGTDFEDGSPTMFVIYKWPEVRAFENWQESDEYRPLKELRLESANVRLSIVPATSQ